MKTNEWAGTGNHYTAEFWEMDPRIGRRLNLDPVGDPWQSSYSIFDNSPIAKNDPDGDCTDCPTEANKLNDAAGKGTLPDGHKCEDQDHHWYVWDKGAGAARPLESGDMSPALRNLNTPPSQAPGNPESERSLHEMDEFMINITPLVGEANILSHIVGGKGLQDWDNGKPADGLSDRLNYASAMFGVRGMRNPAVRSAANLGNAVHYDNLNGGTGEALPTELSKKYSGTDFQFTPRGAGGVDVQYQRGIHPSQYPGSTWKPGNDFADFKPATPSGIYNFDKKVKTGKLPQNTEMLLYDPQTGKLK